MCNILSIVGSRPPERDEVTELLGMKSNGLTYQRQSRNETDLEHNHNAGKNKSTALHITYNKSKKEESLKWGDRRENVREHET